MILRMHSAPIGRVEVYRRRWIAAAKGPILAHMGPQSCDPGLALGQHRDRRVVAVDALRRKHMPPDQLIKWPKRCRHSAHVIGHGRERDLHSFAGILLALPVQRLVVGILLHQDHRQQARPGITPRDRMERCRWLGDRLASPAAELLSNVLGHEPLPGDHIQCPGNVLADLRQLGTAAAGTRRRCRVDNSPARQIVRKHPALRLAAG